MAKHYGATVTATASPGKHEAVRVLGADHVLDSRSPDLVLQVLELTGGAGVDLVLESVGGAMFEVSLAAAKRVTGRVVVNGLPAGDAALTHWDLVYRHQIHVVGLNIGVLSQSAPKMFADVMGEMCALIAAGVLAPDRPLSTILATGRRPSRNWRHMPPRASSPCCPDGPQPRRRGGRQGNRVRLP
ncbi:zinc-binding dehydrogenase [Streptomyces canus]|uniref:zinc-binding dehydrogenase n=1 Tax=Streptomyces canus TaxID=58343 RepID=UPI0033A10861